MMSSGRFQGMPDVTLVRMPGIYGLYVVVVGGHDKCQAKIEEKGV